MKKQQSWVYGRYIEFMGAPPCVRSQLWLYVVVYIRLHLVEVQPQ